MSEMVERVAKALAAKAWAKFRVVDAGICDREYPGGKDQYVSRQWGLYVDSAETAIVALREPTEAMIEAGQDDFAPSARDVWQEMIDEALKPSPATP